MCLGTGTPASERIVAGTSTKVTRSSTTVPAWDPSGKRIMNGTWRPESSTSRLPRGSGPPLSE